MANESTELSAEEQEAKAMAEATAFMNGQEGNETPAAPAPEVPPPPVAAETPSEPLHRGFLGDIKTQDELRVYVKNLEDTVVRQAAAQGTHPQNTLVPPVPASPPGKTIEDEIQENWFSDPAKALKLIDQRNAQIQAQRDETQRIQNEFWTNFWQKNPDLKRVERVVQSINREKADQIRTLRTGQEVADFIAREAREVVGYVTKAVGGVETRLDSKPAVTLGASGEVPPAPPAPPAKPVSFIDQIRKGQRRSGK